MNLSPIGNRALIKLEADKTEIDGIYIPDNARSSRPQIGEIVALGNGDMDGLEIGDNVLLPKVGGREVELFDKSRGLILDVRDVLGKWSPE